MKREFLALSIISIVVFSGAQADARARRFEEFWNTLEAFELSGAHNQVLQQALCGLGVAALNTLREQVLDMFPALKIRKQKATEDLQHAAAQLAQARTMKGKKNKTKERALEAEVTRATLALDDIENEIEAQLRTIPDISEEFNRIQNAMTRWCD